MSTDNKPADVLAVEKSFDDHFECEFSIDEYKRTPDAPAIAVHTDLPLNFDVPYANEYQRELLLKALTDLSQNFDFSFNLDFESLDEIEAFMPDIM